MSILLFLSAIILLMLGHYFKMLRWKQFVEIYETPSEGFSCGHFHLVIWSIFVCPFD